MSDVQRSAEDPPATDQVAHREQGVGNAADPPPADQVAHQEQGIQHGDHNTMHNYYYLAGRSGAGIGADVAAEVADEGGRGWRRLAAPPWVWLLAPALAVAALVMFWPWYPRSSLTGVPDFAVVAFHLTGLAGAVYLGWLGLRRAGSVVLLLVVAGAVAAPPRTGPAGVACGSATIVVQPSLKSWADSVLARMVTEGSVPCVEAVRLVRDDGDVPAMLKTPGAPVGGIITSEAEVVRNLAAGSTGQREPRWLGVAVTAEPVPQWTGIGRDVATVFLDSEDRVSKDSVPYEWSIVVTDLPAPEFRTDVTRDAVAARVAAELGADWPARLRPSRRPDDAWTGAGPCPTGVIVPASWAEPPCSSERLVRATVVDPASNPLGVAVFGIPMRASSAQTAPGEQVRRAVTRFFARLRDSSSTATSYLIELTGSTTDGVKEITGLPELTVRPAVHLVAVVDASLSTGRSDAGRGGGGGGAGRDSGTPLEAALAGLTGFTNGDVPHPGDRLTVLIAQAGTDRRPLEWTASPAGGLTIPRVTARSGTDLPAALARARGLTTDGRRVTVLLTDGVNLFQEDRLDAAELRDLSVLAIGAGPGCAEVPPALWDRCRTASASGEDVAARLAHLFGS